MTQYTKMSKKFCLQDNKDVCDVNGTSLGLVLLCSAQYEQLCMATVRSHTEVGQVRGEEDSQRLLGRDPQPGVAGLGNQKWLLGPSTGIIVSGGGKSKWQVLLEGHQLWARRPRLYPAFTFTMCP